MVGSASVDFSAITLKNITLDEQNKVGTVRISVMPQDLMAGRLTHVDIEGLTLFIAGPFAGGGDGGPLVIPLRSLALNQAVVHFTTPWGIMPFHIDGTLIERDGGHQWNSAVTGEAPFAKVAGRLSAEIGENGAIKAHLEIAEGRLSIPDYEVKRLGGWISAEIAPGAPAAINAQLTAGAVRAQGTAFQGTTLSVSNTPRKTEVLLSATAANNAGDITLDGKMDHTTNKGTLDFRAHVKDKLNLDADAKLTFDYDPSAQALRFAGSATPKKGLPAVKITGRHDGPTGTGKATLTLPPVEGGKIREIFPDIDKYIQETSGTVGVSANIGWGKNGLLTAGEVLLKKFAGKAKGNAFSDVNAVIRLDSLLPPVFRNQTVAVGQLNAGLPLTEGTVTVSLDQKNNFSLHAASWTLAKGNISSSPFTMSLDDMTTDVTLTATNLDLVELFRLAPMEGLDATGAVNGTLPLKIRNGNVAIENGVLETSGTGAIRYNPKEVPAFLQDTSKQQIVDLRVALKAFDYESLKLTLSGEAGKDQKISLQVKGKNPEFYGGRPVHLNFNVEGPIENVIRYSPGNSRIPDAIQKEMEAYEKEHAQ